jgi:hypothetical protein
VHSGCQTSADTPNTGDGMRRQICTQLSDTNTTLQICAKLSDKNTNHNNTHNDTHSEHPQYATANLTDMAVAYGWMDEM